MAGHSKWANIKRQKARVDAKKGQVFARLSRAIIVAARNGLPDPDANFQLRSAIDKAKAAGIPNENIDRAIAKGSGQLDQDSDRWEAIRYEGYGPGGVAVLIEAFTDNRNRTAADLRAAFSKNDGNLGETGCVSWMFTQKGVITLAAPLEEEKLLETLIEAEAESYSIVADVADAESPIIEVYSSVEALEAATHYLRTQGYEIRDVEPRWIPSNMQEITDLDQAQKLIKLTDALDELDDVQSVTANFDLTESVLAAIDI